MSFQGTSGLRNEKSTKKTVIYWRKRSKREAFQNVRSCKRDNMYQVGYECGSGLKRRAARLEVAGI